MKRLLTITLAVLGMATASFAGTTATGAATVSPTLQVNATVQSVISLTLSTGSAAGIATHCNPGAAAGTDPNYTMSFGNVDALGLTAPTCGKSFGITGTTPGATGNDAIYATDYVLTPAFAGQLGGNTGTVKAYVSTNFVPTNLYVVYETANTGAVPTDAQGGTFTAMPTTSGTAYTVAANAASGTGVTRLVGVGVKPTNGAGSSGVAGSATITYTLTIP
jgi:hypothetical protein